MTRNIFDYTGRMLSPTKTAPKGHICVWNANIVTDKKEKIWFGDLDLNTDSEDLQRYANELGQTIYVLREMDARFLRPGEEVDLDRAVAVFAPKE